MQHLKHLFIIGAPKAGTSTLAELLGTHPDIYQGASKEPRFYCDFAERNWTGPGSALFVDTMTTQQDAYDALFADAPAGVWRLDASTDYLSNATARMRLAQLARSRPVKLMCVLRDPVERVISEYRHTLRDLLERETLIDALAKEDMRRQNGWQPLFWHIRRSLYHSDITAYQAAFGEDLLLVDFAELRDQKTLKTRVLQFLGLSDAPSAKDEGRPEQQPELVRNESYSYRSPWVQRALLNPRVRLTAQKLLPRPMRSWLWHRFDQANRATYHPSEQDLKTIHAALERDIRQCLADPTIPTGSWTIARQLTGSVEEAGVTKTPSDASDVTLDRGA